MDDNFISDFENMQVAFPHLEHLHIHGVDNVKKIWDDQLPQDSFSKLKVVGVESCGGLLNIFPSCVLKRSQSLHTLIVKDCISLKVVFDMEGMDVNANEEGVTIVPLSALALYSLPKVEKIWNKDSHGILSFQYLKSIMIHKCESVKNLLPASLVKDLQQLEKLHVSCSGIEEIIAKDINGVLDTDTEPMFVFPKVTSLELYLLPELKSLYPGAHTSQWPLLEILNVYMCPKLTVFAFETPTFEQRHHEGNLHMPLFFIHHVSFLFPNLITSSCFLIKFASLVTFSPPYLSPLNFLILKFVLILYALFGTRKVKRNKHREDNREEKWKEIKFGGK